MDFLADFAERASRLLVAPGQSLVVLMHRSFESDSDAHDDSIQERYAQVFVAAFKSTRSAIGVALGELVPIDDEAIPLSGVFRSAAWMRNGRTLWLAAAHEDRDVPFVLAMGTD